MSHHTTATIEDICILFDKDRQKFWDLIVEWMENQVKRDFSIISRTNNEIIFKGIYGHNSIFRFNENGNLEYECDDMLEAQLLKMIDENQLKILMMGWKEEMEMQGVTTLEFDKDAIVNIIVSESGKKSLGDKISDMISTEARKKGKVMSPSKRRDTRARRGIHYKGKVTSRTRRRTAQMTRR